MHHISLLRRIYICYIPCHLLTQTVTPTITSFQGIKICAQYLASYPHKPIFHPSNYYDVSNAIRLTWSVNQVEDYTSHNDLECHQDSDNAIIINIGRLFSGIIHTLLGVSV